MISCQDKHELFRTVACGCGYAYEYNDLGISEAIKTVAPLWSAVAHLICIEAHGKVGMAIRWGVRNEDLERLFRTSAVTRNMPSYYSENSVSDNIYKPVNIDELRELFAGAFQSCDNLSRHITTENGLLNAIRKRGGSALLDGYIVCGRTIEDGSVRSSV